MRIEIHAILPAAGVNFMEKRSVEMLVAVEAALKGPVKDQLKRAFSKRVSNWGSKPEFAGYFSRRGKDGYALLVSPRGGNAEKWKWVSGGTSAHGIDAVNSPVLRFQKFYEPRTRPGNRYGGPGRKYGPWQNVKSVQHPGIKPRDFEQHIADDEAPSIISLLETVIRRVLTT